MATLDMGPIRVVGCVFTKSNNPNGQYTLTLQVGPNEVDVVASTAGNNVRIFMNGEQLESPPVFPVTPAEDYH